MISVACECGKSLRASDTMAGKKAKCPACGKTVHVPTLTSPSPKPHASQPQANPQPSAPPVRTKAKPPQTRTQARPQPPATQVQAKQEPDSQQAGADRSRHPFNRVNKYVFYDPNLRRFVFWFGICLIGPIIASAGIPIVVIEGAEHALVGIPIFLAVGLIGGAAIGSFVWFMLRTVEKLGFVQYAKQPKALVAWFKLPCNQCGKVMTVASRQIGDAVECPGCNAVVTVTAPQQWQTTRSSLSFDVEHACGELGKVKAPATLVVDRERLTISGGELEDNLLIDRSDAPNDLALVGYLAVKKPDGRLWFDVPPNGLETIAAWVPSNASKPETWWMGRVGQIIIWLCIIGGGLGAVGGLLIALSGGGIVVLTIQLLWFAAGIGLFRATRTAKKATAERDRFEEYLAGSFESG